MYRRLAVTTSTTALVAAVILFPYRESQSQAVPKGDPHSIQQLILEGCRDAGPGRLSLPAGEFTTGCLTIPSHCTVEGASTGTTLRLAPASNSCYLISNHSPDSGNTAITLRRLTLDGNAAQQSPGPNERTGGLTFTAVQGFRLEDIRVVNAYHHGIQVLDRSRDGVILRAEVDGTTNGSGIIIGSGRAVAANISIEHAVVRNIRRANCIFIIGSKTPGAYGTSDVTIVEPQTSRCGDVDIEIGDSSQRITLLGGVVRPAGEGRSGVMVRSARDVLIRDTRCEADGSRQQDCFFIWSEQGDNALAGDITLHNTLARNPGRAGYYVASATPGAVSNVHFRGVKTERAGVQDFVISTNARGVRHTAE